MTILIATGVYPPESGGPATYTKLLEDRLPALGTKVLVLPFSGVRHLPPGIRHAAYFFKVLARGWRADVVFAQDTVSVGLPAGLAARLMGKKFLVRVPGDYAWEQGRQRFGVTESLDDFQSKTYGPGVALLRALQRMTLGLAHAVIAPSRYFAGIVLGWRAGPPPQAIYNGIDSPDEGIKAKELPRPCLVSVGRLVPWKGFDVLIKLTPSLPQWHLVIIGDGPDRMRLETLANRCGVAGRVRFAGQMPNAEVLAHLKGADAFVLNTSFESFSFLIVEAMAMRVPVIATTVGSIPELVQSGKEGILVAPDDEQALKEAIESVLHDPQAWVARVEAASQKAQQFSIDKTLGELLKVLKQL